MISDEKSHKRCEASGEKERVFAKGNYSYYTLFLTKFQLPILSSQGKSKVQREHGAAIPRRATARVPTPLYTAPALTMITKRASPATSHCKGGGGVERGGDPCGRPAGVKCHGGSAPCTWTFT